MNTVLLNFALWGPLWLLELQSVSWFEPAAWKNFLVPPIVVAIKQLISAAGRIYLDCRSNLHTALDCLPVTINYRLTI